MTEPASISANPSAGHSAPSAQFGRTIPLWNGFPVLPCAEVRRLDRFAADRLGIPLEILMENAGRTLTDSLLRYFPPEKRLKKVLILAGKGNNGGDGMVMARHLALAGVESDLVLFAPDSAYSGPAELNLRILRSLKSPLIRISAFTDTPDGWAAFLEREQQAGLIVDSLLGTGAAGSPRSPFDRVIESANHSQKPIFSVDIPSGLNAETGIPAHPAIRAALTCTLAAVKPGLIQESAAEFVGRLECGSIGFSIPDEFYGENYDEIYDKKNNEIKRRT